jgi:hypothetical protein
MSDNEIVAIYPDGRRVRLRVKRDTDKLDTGGRWKRQELEWLARTSRRAAFEKILSVGKAECDDEIDDAVDDALAERDDERDDGGDRENGGDANKNHPLVALTRLLVASGRFGDHGQALHHLLYHRDGQRLVTRMKAAEPEKESTTMDRIEGLTDAMKGVGMETFCKNLIANASEGVSEHELTEAATRYAKSLYPDLSGPQAFARLFESDVNLRRACQIAKTASDTNYRPFVTEARVTAENFRPVVVSGSDAYDAVFDQKNALDELAALGRKLYPKLPSNQAFAKVFEDPKYAALAARAHQRPIATTSFPFPH